jgi:hypothetical protein
MAQQAGGCITRHRMAATTNSSSRMELPELQQQQVGALQQAQRAILALLQSGQVTCPWARPRVSFTHLQCIWTLWASKLPSQGSTHTI